MIAPFAWSSSWPGWSTHTPAVISAITNEQQSAALGDVITPHSTRSTRRSTRTHQLHPSVAFGEQTTKLFGLPGNASLASRSHWTGFDARTVAPVCAMVV